ncbi:DUF4129 domain-containing protein [Mycolicibacterium sediminis]|uniref:Membrane protein n=1 Tax=Mycolicibacterium sediminis TaxID=1286180 RepID=A0A7I7QJZ0_9MYCO|nr:DUF4129 domain-containing protein [Mycolicibacterium sediminis]BBY26357.1 membrane protein [Mycolicibacterium sediminis]
MTALDVDRDAAHDAAQRELSRPIYPTGSLTDRLAGWLDDLLYRLMVGGASFPGGWLTVTVLLLLLLAALVVAVRVASRTMRTNRGGDTPLFDSHLRTSSEHRVAAEQYAARGEWAAAIRHRLRAVARHLEEAEVLDPMPGRTATELARDAATAMPDLTGDLRSAAIEFNDVTYGERPGTEAGYRIVADLDDRLLRRSVSRADTSAPADEVDSWAEIR